LPDKANAKNIGLERTDFSLQLRFRETCQEGCLTAKSLIWGERGIGPLKGSRLPRRLS